MSHVVASFDRAATHYKAFAHIQRLAAEKLAAFIPNSKKSRALELAAGCGFFTQHLVSWEGEILATDGSKRMCLEGQKNIDSIPWKQMNLVSPTDGPWDYIFSSSALQWVDSPLDVFKAWRQVLTPNGRIVCSLFTEGTLKEWLFVSKGISPVKWRSLHSWERSLNEAGFKLLKQQSETLTTYYPSALDCLKALRGMGATPQSLINPAKLRTLLKEYDSAYKIDQVVVCSWAVYRFEATLL